MRHVHVYYFGLSNPGHCIHLFVPDASELWRRQCKVNTGEKGWVLYLCSDVECRYPGMHNRLQRRLGSSTGSQAFRHHPSIPQWLTLQVTSFALAVPCRSTASGGETYGVTTELRSVAICSNLKSSKANTSKRKS